MKTAFFCKILCLLLVLTCTLSGCSFRIDPHGKPNERDPEPPTTEPTSATQETDPYETRDPLPPVDRPEVENAVVFDEIKYERPDFQLVIDTMDAITAKIEQNSASAEEILADLDHFDEVFKHFDTMMAYAYVRYCLDLSDEYYDDEYNLLNDQTPLIQAAYERAAIAAASSPIRTELEEYFTAEELEFYETHRVYSNEAYVELALKENALQSQYMDLQDSQTILFQGKERDMDELLEEYSEDINTLYNVIYPAYYSKYNKLCADIYVELIQVRRELAEVTGYDSYQDFMFDFYYQRDYTPEEARSYVKSLIRDLQPLVMDAEMNSYGTTYRSVTMEQAKQTVMASLSRIDPEYAGYFQFMEDYSLWDVTTSSSKMPGSYETYLWDYSSPFVYISPVGNEADISTLAHEFGHFVDSMHNENEDTCLDQCETFSQGMEYLNLLYSDLPEKTVDRLLAQKMVDAMSVFVYQGIYAEFEDRVYQLKDPTVDSINRTYKQVMQEYGMSYGIDWYDSYIWVDITHFFEAPCYIISYCTSADAAFQIFTMEKNEAGAGVAAYRQLLENVTEHDFQELLALCGMESPFQAGRSKELAKQFKAYLK